MENIIAEHCSSDLIIQVEEMNEKDFIGRVLVGDICNPVGTYSTWSTSAFHIRNNEPKKEKKALDLYSSDELEKWKNEGKDEIVQKVVYKFKERSKVGIEKYGTTLKDNNTDDFHNHLSEELMDALLYLEKIKEQKDTYFLLLGRYNELKEQFNKLQAKIKELC
jgi:hypothetical protein